MSALLPWVFVIMAALAVVAALGSLWISLSMALSDESFRGVRAELISDARRGLLVEKEALLQEIRDVSFEHDADKLSDADFDDLNAKLRAQARHVLHELDAGAEAFREEAEALIAERVGKKA